ncbi:MAG: thioredoxin [Euryarchaeota archaeon]|nr:thioredoxin [Euryarchaeota archaeon]
MDEVERIKKEKLRKMMTESKKPAEVTGPMEVTDSNFNEVTSKKKYAMVDCWAEWCMPCKMLSPVVEQLAKEYSDNVIVGKLDVDHNKQTAIKYGIRSIPAVLFFKDGKLAGNSIGAVPKKVLEARLKQVME